MNIIFYHTGCSKCKVLESKLKQSNLEYSEFTDKDKMIEAGIRSVPVLLVDGKALGFREAVQFLNNIKS